MSERKSLAQLPPQQKAIVGTAVVALLLAVAAGVAFWYGKQSAGDTSTTATTNDTNSSTTAGGSSGTTVQKIAGKVIKVLGDSVEISTGAGETTQTVTAIINDATQLRKIDYRNIPKTGVGDGVPLKREEITTGASIVVTADDLTSNQVTATKLSLLIYP